MRKIAILLFTILATFSCKKDNNAPVSKNLKGCSFGYLLFFEDLDWLNSERSIILSPGDTSGGICKYIYENGKIGKSFGGFYGMPTGNYMFSTDIYDSIHYDSNRIYTYSKSKFDNTVHESTYNPTIYILDSQKRIIQIFKKDNYRPNGYNIYYTYSDQLITETNDNGQTTRSYYFENKNLVKVETDSYDSKGVLVMKKEIVFKDFDSKTNPFKNLYYLKGAFYRAFSENNYQRYIITSYMKLSDGTFETLRTFSSSLPIVYDADGYPNFEVYE